MLFSTCSWRFLISKKLDRLELKLEQLEFKFEKKLGFRNVQGKLENFVASQTNIWPFLVFRALLANAVTLCL